MIIILFVSNINVQAQQISQVNQFVLTSLQEASLDQLNRNKNIREVKKIFSTPDIYKVVTNLTLNEVRSLAPRTHVRSAVTLEDRLTVPDDPLFFDQWHLDKIKASLAWDISTGGSNQTGSQPIVAIFDRGVDQRHFDLEENFAFNPGEIPNDGIDNDQNGYIDDYFGLNLSTQNDQHAVKLHGTAVMGSAFARGDNDEGISGISWQQPVFFLSKSNGPLQDIHYIEAFEYIKNLRKKYNESNGAEGLNIVASSASSGIFNQKAEDFPEWCAVYNALGEVGILSLVATDNQYANVDETGDMPTVCTSDYIIAVTSSDREDKVQHAAYGPQSVDLAAPGRSVLTTTLENKYNSTLSGTSLATPIVAGAVSLVYSAASQDLANKIAVSPNEGALIIKSIILGQVDPIADLSNKTTSGGRLNLFNSVNASANWVTETERQFEFLNINPSGQITYRMDQDVDSEVAVFNIIGQKVYQNTVSHCLIGLCTSQLPVNRWASGTYVVQISARGETIEQSVIIP